MRILKIISDFSVGGAERVSASLANGLASDSNTVSLLVFNSINENHILKSIDRSVKKLSLRKDITPKWSFLFSLFRTLTIKRDYDIIIAHLHPVAYYLGLLLPLIRTPVIYVIHNEYSKIANPVKRRIILRFYKSKKVHLVSVSKGIHDHFRNEYGLSTSLIMNGISKPLLTERADEVKKEIDGYKLSEKTLVFIAVSRLVWFKNLPALALSFREIRKLGKDSILIILGEDPDNEKKELKKISEVGADNVYILGSRQNVGDYLDNSDCYCQVSSGFEGTPVALLEAISFGLPVIASNASGLVSIIKHKENGVICNPDCDSISQALLSFIELTSDQKEQISNNNINLFKLKFNESAMLKSYSNLMKESLHLSR
jgi:glycosyltransferase involved in cell wall biosynthesis